MKKSLFVVGACCFLVFSGSIAQPGAAAALKAKAIKLVSDPALPMPPKE